MRWPVALFAFPLSVGFSMLVVSSCGSPGLGIGNSQFGSGGTTTTGTFTNGGAGGAGGTGAATTSSSSTSGIFIDSGPVSDGSFGMCVPKTCAELGFTCGPAGDGCGGLIECGNCVAPATCGGGGKPSQCGGNNNCTPATSCPALIKCGPTGDGCGGVLQCGSCAAPTTCGGGGTSSQCGGMGACVPTTCALKNVNCGPIGDGCGGLLQCGSCITPETCGGGGVPGQCGSGAADAGDAGVTCIPKTSCPAGENCGPAGDGCGGQLDCGTCTSPQSCGGGGTPSKCGGNSGCIPNTCAALGINCGPTGDGCGNELNCGACVAPLTCGGGGVPGVCGGTNDCVPKTCATLGFNCGPAGDGCGGLLQCGSCTAPEICGGGGMPGVCGPADAGAGCTGLCLQQTTCPGSSGITTTVSGTVYAPNGTDPLYNATVYVPNGGPAPGYGVTGFTTGVHCGQCGSEISGSPLVSTTTAPDGTFTLQNVPVGTQIPLVIQLGRWRHGLYIPTVASCTNTTLTAAQTSLPSVEPSPIAAPPPTVVTNLSFADNIPLMAFSTGAVDGLECVLLKIGINQNQFSNPALQGGAGRIRFYLGESAATGSAGPGAQISATTPSSTQLWGGTTPDIDQYDMVFFPCQGQVSTETQAHQQTVINYTNAGGRIFATHYSYGWFIGPKPTTFLNTANWTPGTGQLADQTGYINTGFARGQALAQWLQIVGASTTYAQMPLQVLRDDFTNVVSPSLLWVTLGGAVPNFTNPMHYTFDTPVGSAPAAQCGRALFDDFHVENANYNAGITFPNECPAASVAMTPQEKMLEFMIFDLGSCITPTVYTPPTCTPTTCGAQNIACGPAGDGCGNEIASCGTCTAPQTCGGGGIPGQCGGVPCVPTTCSAQGIACGPAGDGCGNLIQCGNCPNGTTCGGGGVHGQCGKQTCTPVTCASQGIQCGPAGNGCGGLLVCGTCPPGQTCGGGGPGKCGAPDASTCIPLTCASQGIQCGPAGDGCGGQLACGNCVAPQTCGGGGVPGVCGEAICVPTTCATLGVQCGPAGDGCGGLLQCGTCSGGEMCGACTTPGTCGTCCVPETCASQKIACGPAGDGCGGLLQCGTCTAPDTCGGGGTSGQCGHQQTN
jgi:hypothetical protein